MGSKIFLTLVLVAVALDYAFTFEMPEDQKKAFMECGQEMSIPMDELVQLGKASKTDADAAKKFGCFMSCFFDKMDGWDGDKLNMDLIKEHVKAKYQPTEEDLAKVEEGLSQCYAEVEGKTDKCEIAGTFMHCIRKTFGKHD